jgi:mRNA-degrading endonuclease RelE of RelBE toxin-antitoxin system
MTYSFTATGFKDYQAFPKDIQHRFEKQLGFILADLRYPSLKAKKYGEARDIWQARVDRSYRFYFQIEGDNYLILRIIPHPK